MVPFSVRGFATVVLVVHTFIYSGFRFLFCFFLSLLLRYFYIVHHYGCGGSVQNAFLPPPLFFLFLDLRWLLDLGFLDRGSPALA